MENVLLSYARMMYETRCSISANCRHRGALQLLKEPIKIDGRQVVDGTYEENVVNTEAPTDPQSAQLTLTKTVSGAADPTKAYHFTISLTDAATDGAHQCQVW